MVTPGPELMLDVEAANKDVPLIAITPQPAPRTDSVLVVTRIRVLGEALADVLLRIGYDVHLAPPSCGPGSIVARACAIRAGLVLLDLPARSPTTAMSEAIAELYRDHVRVVVLGPSTSSRNRATSIAVDGWASRSDSLTSLVDAVRRSAPIGAATCPLDLDQAPAPDIGAHELGGSTGRSRFELLTPRERHVLMALMDGIPPVKIARQSFMSTSTVRHHIRSILLKLNVNSQLAAVVAAYQAGWPSVPPTTLSTPFFASPAVSRRSDRLPAPHATREHVSL